jgi:hypothetical protein
VEAWFDEEDGGETDQSWVTFEKLASDSFAERLQRRCLSIDWDAQVAHSPAENAR